MSRPGAFDHAIFAAEWDYSAAASAWARYLELQPISPEQATGYFLAARAAIVDARAALNRSERVVVGRGRRTLPKGAAS